MIDDFECTKAAKNIAYPTKQYLAKDNNPWNRLLLPADYYRFLACKFSTHATIHAS